MNMKRFLKPISRGLPALIVIGLLAMFCFPPVVPAASAITAPVFTRTLPGESLAPGDTFDVTVTVTANADEFAVGVEDFTPCAPSTWAVTANPSWCSPATNPDGGGSWMYGGATAGKYDMTWVGVVWDNGTNFSFLYRVTVPSDTPAGTYSFGCGLGGYSYGGGGAMAVAITGDSQVEVRADDVWVDDDWDEQEDVDDYDDSLVWQYNAFNTTQDGIDNVSGSTVHVLPGTYDSEPFWPIAVNQTGLTLVSVGTTEETIIDPGANGQGALNISAEDVTIDGFTVIGGSQTHNATQPIEHVIWVNADYSTIKNCDILLDRGNTAGIYIGDRRTNSPTGAIWGYDIPRPDGHTIENNSFRCKASGEGWGIFAYMLSEDSLIKDNNFIGDAADVGNWGADEGAPGTGIIIHEAGVCVGTNSVVIEGNTARYVKYTWLTFYSAYPYNDSVGYMYEQPAVSEIEDVLVQDNTVHDCRTAINFHRAEKDDAYGVKGADLIIGSGGVVIGDGNEFYDNEDGVLVDDPEEYEVLTGNYSCVQYPDRIHINHNNIYDNYSLTCGVDNGAWPGITGQTNGGIVDALLNWWGDPTGPEAPDNPDGAGDVVTGNVTFEPWLMSQWSSTDTSDTNTEDLDEGDTVTAGAASATATSGSDIVTVAEYVENPSGSSFYGDTGTYIDVYVPSPTDIDELLIKLYYDEGDLDPDVDEETLAMYWWDGDDWSRCSSTGVETAADYIWARITGGSSPSIDDLSGTFFGGGALEPEEEEEEAAAAAGLLTPPESASFVASYMKVSPQQVLPGQEVEISINIANHGGESGAHNVALFIDGYVEQSQTVSVSPGATRLVVFRTSKTVPGTYEVAMEGAQGQFIVLDISESTAQPSATASGGLGTAGIVTIVIIVLALIVAMVFIFRSTSRP